MKLAGAYIGDDKYAAIVAVAEKHNRTLAGQCRHWFDEGLRVEALKSQPPEPPKPSARIAKVLSKHSAKKGRV